MAYKQEMWDKAKKRCRLGDEELRIAKERLKYFHESLEGFRRKCYNIQDRQFLWRHSSAGRASA